MGGAMKLVMAGNRPDYDAYGRVRVDCGGEFEDWILPEDLPQELLWQVNMDQQDAQDAQNKQSGGVGYLTIAEAVTEPPAPAVTPSVSARELAAALKEPASPSRGTTGRQLSPEEVAARRRTEEAKASKAEAEAAIAQARAERERLRTEQLEITLFPATPVVPTSAPAPQAPTPQAAAPAVAPPLPPDPVLEARQRRQVAQERFEELQLNLQREALEDEVARQRTGHNPNAPLGVGILVFFLASAVFQSVMIGLGDNGWMMGPMFLPVTVGAGWLAARLVRRGQEAAEQRETAPERRAAHDAQRPQQEAVR